jgi:hypothetical protein
MKHLIQLGTVLAAYFGTTGSAYAIFSTGPSPDSVPEPATTALLVAGGLAAGGLRYLIKRKRDNKRDE